MQATGDDDFSSWPTAKTTPGAYTRDRGDPEKERASLEGAAIVWPTPKALTGGPNSQRENREDTGGADLQEAVKTWATPQSRDGDHRSAQRTWPTPNATDGDKAPETFSRGEGNPSLPGAAKNWPSPQARDHKNPESSSATAEKNSRPLNELASRFSPQVPATHDGPTSSPQRQTLNPRFVEWLMGWPIGWTACDSVVTGFPLWLRRMRSAYLAMPLAPTLDAQGQRDLFPER